MTTAIAKESNLIGSAHLVRVYNTQLIGKLIVTLLTSDGKIWWGLIQFESRVVKSVAFLIYSKTSHNECSF